MGHPGRTNVSTRWLRLPDHTAECKKCQGDPILEEKRKLTKQRETGKTDQGLGKKIDGGGEGGNFNGDLYVSYVGNLKLKKISVICTKYGI